MNSILHDQGESRDEKLRVTLVCNAGVLLEYRGTKVLLDSIYGPEGHPFSNLTDVTWQQMLQVEGLFSKVDYLLFTHAHPDHFSPAMTMEYLRHRPVKGIFKPQADRPDSALDAFLRERRIPCVDLSRKTDHAAFRVEPHLTVRAFTAQHLDRKFWGVRHLCYVLSFDDKHVLFTADVDYMSTSFDVVKDLPLRAVFLNPLFFRAFHNPKFFHGSLKAENYCVYHVPFKEDDTMQMRYMLQRDLANWPSGEGTAMALTEPWQTVEL